ncbi:hypothetical protein H0H92_011985 [Tricholoma furcatifolium]|nr:hypothetical protein H0H92_011985 [Tricholoma furcatifolium]
MPPVNSDLVFNYDASPFAFWISRRSQPQAPPLFDTRISSLPATPTGPVIANDNSTVLHDFPLIFENQYLQLTSSLPLDTNIYGLGEVVASSGFRRNVAVNGGSIQTMWARDIADPVDENLYGAHPMYLEHRFDDVTNTSLSHGVFLMSAAGGDILLLTPEDAMASLIQYRMIGGVLDFYFFSGPSPMAVIEQYGELIGLPTWQPAWGFGFHLCRWGYRDLDETRSQVVKMREANIPLEVMWSDIDLYHAYRDFTTDPVSFPVEDLHTFIEELSADYQKYIPIVDAGIAKLANDSDSYDSYTRGSELPNAQNWWTEALRNWTEAGVKFSGIWLDMNEASSFCDGSCYDFVSSGPSGNITVNGTRTCQTKVTIPQTYDFCEIGMDLKTSAYMIHDDSGTYASCDVIENATHLEEKATLHTCQAEIAAHKRDIAIRHQEGVNLNNPPYAIHNGFATLSTNTLATNATHVDGQVELDVHNLWGMMEEKATHFALKEIFPGKRPFLISRSTFPSSGKWTGHWLGDNHSLWSYLRYSIAGVLQFQLFQIPFVGADTCGFNGNTDEELCNRWMQLSAFTPFYRNHNVRGAIPQEPYRWDSVADASRTAIAIRYALLPYWYTLFANSSSHGTPPVRALFFEFPNEPELFDVATQFLIGRDILVTPVLNPNVTTVNALFPGRGHVIWRDWYTHEAVDAAPGTYTTLSAPLGHINVHIRDGSAILLHAKPSYTVEETRQGPFSLLISQSASGQASGSAYIDDGVSDPPGPSTTLNFSVSDCEVLVTNYGTFRILQQLSDIIVLGVSRRPDVVYLNDEIVDTWEYVSGNAKLMVQNLNSDLNNPLRLHWCGNNLSK